MNQTFIIIGLIVLLILIFSFAQNKRWERKLQKVNASRPKLSRSEYVERLVKKGYDKRHAEVVHDEIKKFIALDDFSMYPEDDIHKLYRIEDLDDIGLIDTICEKLNIRKAEQKDVVELNRTFEKTDAEYILALTKKLSE